MQDTPPPDISAVLFDKDGTLLDYHLTWTGINRDAAIFAASGDPARAQQYLVAGGWQEETQRYRPGSMLAAGTTTEIAQLWRDHGCAIALQELAEGIDQIFARGMAAAVPVTDLRHEFTSLRAAGFKLGIASSDSAAAVAALTQRFDLVDLVDFAAGYDSGHGVKPGPGMLLAFCRAVGCDPASVAVVGDNVHDMEMAASGGAGLKIAVLTGTGTRAELEPVSHVCLASIVGLATVLATFWEAAPDRS